MKKLTPLQVAQKWSQASGDKVSLRWAKGQEARKAAQPGKSISMTQIDRNPVGVTRTKIDRFAKSDQVQELKRLERMSPQQIAQDKLKDPKGWNIGPKEISGGSLDASGVPRAKQWKKAGYNRKEWKAKGYGDINKPKKTTVAKSAFGVDHGEIAKREH